MRCATHCPPEGGGPPLPAVAGVLAAVAVGAVALRFAESIAEAVCLTVFAACAVCIVLLVRQLWPVRAKQASEVTSLSSLSSLSQRAELPAPRLGLEQAQQVVHVITDARERIGHG